MSTLESSRDIKDETPELEPSKKKKKKTLRPPRPEVGGGSEVGGAVLGRKAPKVLFSETSY